MTQEIEERYRTQFNNKYRTVIRKYKSDLLAQLRDYADQESYRDYLIDADTGKFCEKFFELKTEAHQINNFKKLFLYLEVASEEGFKEASMFLGLLYMSNNRPPISTPNYEKAAEYLTLAGEKLPWYIAVDLANLCINGYSAVYTREDGIKMLKEVAVKQNRGFVLTEREGMKEWYKLE